MPEPEPGPEPGAGAHLAGRVGHTPGDVVRVGRHFVPPSSRAEAGKAGRPLSVVPCVETETPVGLAGLPHHFSGRRRPEAAELAGRPLGRAWPARDRAGRADPPRTAASQDLVRDGRGRDGCTGSPGGAWQLGGTALLLQKEFRWSEKKRTTETSVVVAPAGLPELVVVAM